MELNFSTEEKIKILENYGYDIRKEKVSYMEKSYHNQVDEVELEAYVVYNTCHKTGKMVDRDFWVGNITYEYEHVDHIFGDVFQKIIYDYLLNYKKMIK